MRAKRVALLVAIVMALLGMTGTAYAEDAYMTYHIDGQQDYVEKHEVGDVVTLPDHIDDRVLPEHKIISGWSPSPSGQSRARYEIGDRFTVTDNTTLYAIVTDTPEYETKEGIMIMVTLVAFVVVIGGINLLAGW